MPPVELMLKVQLLLLPPALTTVAARLATARADGVLFDRILKIDRGRAVCKDEKTREDSSMERERARDDGASLLAC